MTISVPRWTHATALEVYELPFATLLYRAHSWHLHHFDLNVVETCQLLNIKTGGCPEDCGYCSQSAHHGTGVQATKLMELSEVIAAARRARDSGATRFCLGAAWRSPKSRDIWQLALMIREVKALGLETCMTLGMLKEGDAARLKDAGLDYYNHNIDTSRRHYSNIVTTRTFQDRLDTLDEVRRAGIKVCCGGIAGMGESAEDRVSMLVTLANLEEPPESVPINLLIPIPGTPLASSPGLDPLELVRTIALARLLMPKARVRLSAGRSGMTEELQALCFFAGANSIFIGETLLTTSNPSESQDAALFRRLGLRALGQNSS
jgi:biotin synthase